MKINGIEYEDEGELITHFSSSWNDDADCGYLFGMIQASIREQIGNYDLIVLQKPIRADGKLAITALGFNRKEKGIKHAADQD